MRMLSSSGPCGRRSCRRALRKDPRRRFPPLLRAADRTEDLATLLERALPELEAAGDDLASLHRIFGARGNRRFAWAPGRHSGGVRASLYPCTAGGLSTSSMFAIRAWCRLAGTTAVSNCLLGSTSTSPRQAGISSSAPTVLGRWPSSGSSTKRGPSSPLRGPSRRSVAGAAAREPECLRVRLDRTLGGRSRRRRRVRSERVQDARGAGRTSLPRFRCRGRWRRRSMHWIGSTTQTPGPVVRCRSARAPTCGRRCSGAR